MNTIATRIKELIEAAGLLYFRSANINDLNQQVGETDISQGIGVYANLPEIENLTYLSNANVLMNYQIEVFFLKLNGEIDDPGTDVDIILDELKPIADGFFDQMIKSDFIPFDQSVEGYDLNAVESLKMTKEVLTGWHLTMTIPIYRKTFNCA